MQEFDAGQLRTLRRRCRLKQDDVAKALHVTSATISNMENGKVKTPADVLAILADLYGVKPGDFFIERLN